MAAKAMALAVASNPSFQELKSDFYHFVRSVFLSVGGHFRLSIILDYAAILNYCDPLWVKDEIFNHILPKQPHIYPLKPY